LQLLQNPAATITFGPKSTSVPYTHMHISPSEPMILEQNVGVSRNRVESGIPNFAPNHAPQWFGRGLEQSLFLWTTPVLASSLVETAAQLVIYNLLFQSRFSSSFLTTTLLRHAYSFPAQLLFVI
jgi:hypothetical protein